MDEIFKILLQVGLILVIFSIPIFKFNSNNILGLKKGCSKEEVISKYKKIMQKLHPDSNQDINTTKLAQIVSEAKETIIKNDFS